MVTLLINRKKKKKILWEFAHIRCHTEDPIIPGRLCLYNYTWGVNGNFASKFTNCFNVDCFKLLFTAFTIAENNIKIVLYWQR